MASPLVSPVQNEPTVVVCRVLPEKTPVFNTDTCSFHSSMGTGVYYIIIRPTDCSVPMSCDNLVAMLPDAMETVYTLCITLESWYNLHKITYESPLSGVSKERLHFSLGFSVHIQPRSTCQYLHNFNCNRRPSFSSRY